MTPSEQEGPGVLLTVAYDGADFSGWARQQNAPRTVTGALEDAILLMNGAPALVRGASRTDAGVHSLGQRAAFDAAREIPPSGWVLGLNSKLPADVAIVGAEPCARGFDPRFDSTGKHYRYVMLQGDLRDPLHRQRAWWIRKDMDVEAMQQGAARLVGTHDFRAFRSADDMRRTTTRTLYEVKVESGYLGDPRLISVDVRGTAFMKNMVRILAGTLFEVGVGRLPPSEMGRLLGPEARREDAGQTAPAHGLTLLSVSLGRAELLAAEGLKRGP